MKVELEVKGMHCSSCEVLLADVVAELPGVKDVKASTKKGKVWFEADGPKAVEAAKQAIRKEGYKVR
ncbi:MAG TPA: heavy metal-associated domain-containing protein [archaeon]|nr:heavy metal-associated domain-containing protein [archaeon]